VVTLRIVNVLKILNIYHFLFARCFYWSKKINGQHRDPVFFASAMVCQGGLVNSITIFYLLNILGIDFSFVISESVVPKVIIAFVALFIFEINHRYFSKGQKYKQIIEQYPYSGNNTFALIYILGSLACMCITMYLAFTHKWG